ncbi:hypothetical protein CR513_14829, partial [Mucuna pruriens]
MAHSIWAIGLQSRPVLGCVSLVETTLLGRDSLDGPRSLHGLSKTIVSYKDSKFLSHFWRTLWSNLGTKLFFSTTCHPQMDEQVEVINRTLSQLLRCFMGSTLLSPLDLLPLPNISSMLNCDGLSNAQFVKDFHAKARSHIEKKVEQYANRANKGKTQRVFKEVRLAKITPSYWFLDLVKEPPVSRKRSLALLDSTSHISATPFVYSHVAHFSVNKAPSRENMLMLLHITIFLRLYTKSPPRTSTTPSTGSTTSTSLQSSNSGISSSLELSISTSSLSIIIIILT